jgi:hypothetical protein
MSFLVPNALRVATLAVCVSSAAAQPAASRVVGTWQGTLQAGPLSLRLGLTVRRDSSGALTGVMTSIDQGGARFPATLVLRGDTLVATMAMVNATYAAVVSAAGDTLRGTFTQGASLPLTLGRVAELSAVVRPQEPKPPFPYRAEEVAFASAPNVRLAGTLTIPDGPGPFPAVVLVTGSGPQDRDETLMGHKPFLVLADHLARHGIATLRYDDRGVARSSGDFVRATSADFADDAEAAVRFLKQRGEILTDRIGIVGHSEGGLIAPMVAARTGDVGFVVLLAGPGLPGDSILVLQTRAIALATGAPPERVERAVSLNRRMYDAVKHARDSADAATHAMAAYREYVATLPAAQQAAATSALSASLGQLVSPWMRYFLAYDPRPALRRVHVPVLALDGTLDLQVPYAPNLAAIDSALAAGGNRDHETVALPRLNHLFQTATTGAPSEYATIEETFAPAALDVITEWITKRFGRR